jgi:hypothetical protein
MFQLEYFVFGMNSAPYLIVNYLLHLGVALAGLRVLRRLDIGEWAATIGAGLFLVGFGHYGKTVIWAASGGTVVATLLCVLAIDLASGRLETVRAKAALAAVALIAPSFHEIGILAGGLALLRSMDARTPARRWCVLIVLVSVFTWAITWIWASRAYHIYGTPYLFQRAPLQLARYLSLFVLPTGDVANASGVVQRFFEVIFRLRVPIGIALASSLGYLAYRVRSTRFLVLWILVGLLPFTLIGYPDYDIQLRYTYPAALPWCAVAAFLLVRLPFRRVVYALVMTIVVYSVSIHLFIERYYDRSTNDPLNRALCDELHQLQERVSGATGANRTKSD